MPTIIPSGTEIFGSGGGNFGSATGPLETVISISSPAIDTSMVLVPTTIATRAETLISVVYSAVATTTIVVPISTPALQTITTLLTILSEGSPNPTGVGTNISEAGIGSQVLTTFVVTSVFTVTTYAPVGGSTAGIGPGLDPGFGPSDIQTGTVPAGTNSPIVTGKATKIEATLLVGFMIIVAAFL